jgi:hypothetical protein
MIRLSKCCATCHYSTFENAPKTTGCCSRFDPARTGEILVNKVMVCDDWMEVDKKSYQKSKRFIKRNERWYKDLAKVNMNLYNKQCEIVMMYNTLDVILKQFVT